MAKEIERAENQISLFNLVDLEKVEEEKNSTDEAPEHPDAVFKVRSTSKRRSLHSENILLQQMNEKLTD